MANKMDLRQSVHRSKLDQLTTDSKYQGTTGGKPSGSTEADNLFTSLNSEITPPLRMMPTDPTADRIVHIEAISIVNPETGKNRIANSINGVLPTFTGATITLPSTADGSSNIVNSNGDNIVGFSQSASKFRKCAVFLLNSGNISLLLGDEAASVALAPYPGAIENAIEIGYFIIETDLSQNIQNVEFSDIYQMSGSGGGGASSSASSGGGELADLMYNARLQDDLDAILDGNTPIDITSGKTDSSLHSIANKYIRLNYDADKTVTGTGTSMTISASPAFTVKAGDVLIVGDEVREITNVASQTSYTIEAAFSSDPSSSACCISQAVHTVDLNAFTYNGQSVSAGSQFTDDITEALVQIEDSSTEGDLVPDWGSTANIATSLSADGSDWSDKTARTEYINDTVTAIAAPTASTNLYLRFFANKTSGTGAVNLLSYKVFWHEDEGALDGENYFTAFARIDSSDFVNCTHSVVGGKSRFTFDEAYPMGLNPTDPSGSAIEIYVDGKLVPRWIDGTLVDTSGDYFKELDAQTIEMDTDYSSTGVDFQFKVPRLVIDTNTQNTTRITQAENYLSEGLQDFIIQDKIDVPHTEIVNRAQIPNFANDLRPRMGIERIMTHDVFEIQDEFGPNGEKVYGTSNDRFGLVRFIGKWSVVRDVKGTHIECDVVGGKVEITFYGTGLNILPYMSSSVYDYRYKTDGGTQSGNIVPSSLSNILSARNYSPNQILNVESGLTEGLHTIEIEINTANTSFYGFEILNEATALKVPTGDAFADRKKVVHSSLESVAYNSSFESGTLGTKGGRVLTYLKSNGTIGKAVTPVDSTAKYLSNTDHSNEEIVRRYHFREFGAYRNDDFSTLISSPDTRAFTLDDGSTTLIAQDGFVTNNQLQVTDNDYWQFSFVGSGLDLYTIFDNSAGNIAISVDDTPVGTFVQPTKPGIINICSGLDYGQHIVRMTRTAGNYCAIAGFVVYQPKTPILPEGAVKLSSYNIVSDFSFDNSISTGIIRKHCSREFVYSGSGFSIAIANYSKFKQRVQAGNSGDYIEYTFFGTGFDLNTRANTSYSNNVSVTLNGSALTSTNFSTAVSNVNGPSFNLSTGVLNTSASNVTEAKFAISGLPLGLYTVGFTNNTSDPFVLFALDIITPIHSHDSNIPSSYQNSLPVGSLSLGDARELVAVKEDIVEPNSWSEAVGIESNPSTNSTLLIPMPDMFTTIKTRKKFLDIDFWANVYSDSSAGTVYFSIQVDGVEVFDSREGLAVTGKDYNPTFNKRIPISEGVHHVQVFWKTNVGTIIAALTKRKLFVKESN